MATAKRKLDDKHLKMLRELVSLPHNKHCFDCNQRGPTYINMTIGSYVCTQCSGLLRGLNPPQRVKSISMMSFTPDEMDFLKARGNDLCRSVWLGLQADGQLSISDNKDVMKVKSDMSIRYEKRRYYVEPSTQMFEQAKLQNQTGSDKKVTTTHHRPLAYVQKTTLSSNQVPPPVQIPSSIPSTFKPSNGISFDSPVHEKKAEPAKNNIDLLSDIGGDLFNTTTAPTIQTAPTVNVNSMLSNPTPPMDLFAMPQSSMLQSNQTTLSSTDAKPCESQDDKYAALMNLNGDTTSKENTMSWSSAFNGQGASVFDTPSTNNAPSSQKQQQQQQQPNPFLSFQSSAGSEANNAFNSSFPTSSSFPSTSNSSQQPIFQPSNQMFCNFSQSSAFPPPNKSGQNFIPNQSGQSFPPTQSGQSFPQNQNRSSFPSSGGQSFPQNQSGQSFPQNQSGQSFPQNQSGQSFPQNQSGQSFPQNQSGQSFPQNQSGQSFPQNQSGQSFPQNQSGQSFAPNQTTPSFNNGFPATQSSTSFPTSSSMFPQQQNNPPPMFEANFSSNFPPQSNTFIQSTNAANTFPQPNPVSNFPSTQQPSSFTSQANSFPSQLNSNTSLFNQPPQPSTTFSQVPPTYRQSFPTQPNNNTFVANFASDTSSASQNKSLPTSQSFPTSNSSNPFPQQQSSAQQPAFGQFDQFNPTTDSKPAANPFMTMTQQTDVPRGSQLNPFL